MKKTDFNPQPRARGVRVAIALAAALCVLGAQSPWSQPSGSTVLAAPVEMREKPALPLKAYSDFISRGITMEFRNGAWVKAIRGVSIDGQPLKSVSSSFSLTDNTYYPLSDIGGTSSLTLKIGKESAEVVIEAEGYAPLRLKIAKKGNKYDVTEVKEQPTVPDKKQEQPADQNLPTIQKKNHEYYLRFPTQPEKMNTLEHVRVRDQEWKRIDRSSVASGEYKINEQNELVLGAARWSSSAPAEIRSGDVVEIQLKNEAPMRFKIVIVDGKPDIIPTTKAGDGYQLHVALVGSFDAAMVGQKNYDSITGATGSVTANKNSDVEVRGLLAPKEQTVLPEQIQSLLSKMGDRVDASKSRVVITPEGSGMKGVYYVNSSQLTLRGVPEKAGQYEVRVQVTDVQGRTAESNALPLTIFEPGQAKLKDLLTKERFSQGDFKKQKDNRYIYTMTPWLVSQLDGEKEDFTVPTEVKAWYGSHRSGIYGVLGKSVPSGSETTQTLRIPNGCNLTLVNMDVLSGVKIVVEKGGRLSLQDAVVQGIVEVQDDGSFSMNHNANGFQSGASINGQLVLKDGAILEDSSIYSNTNFIANGKEVRHNTAPVVSVQGNVTVKGKVFIRGDEAASGKDGQTKQSYSGQPGLEVVNGTMWLSEGARLAVYGGGRNATTSIGGDAIQLKQGRIQGPGTLIALGGQGTWNRGGDGVSGQGTIDVANAFLQGGIAIKPINDAPAGLGNASGVQVSDQTRLKRIDGGTPEAKKESAPMWIGVEVPSEENMEKQFSMKDVPEKATWKALTEIPKAMDKEALKTPNLPRTTSSSFAKDSLTMEFEDAGWIKGIQKVTVGGQEFKNTNNSFFMPDRTYYTRPDNGGRSELSFKGWKSEDEIVIESAGYEPLRMKVTKQGRQYQVSLVEEPIKSQSEPKPEVPVTPAKPQPPVTPEKPAPTEEAGKVPAIPVSIAPNDLAGGLQMEYNDAAWIKEIQKVTVGDKELTKSDNAFSMAENTYYARPDTGGRSSLTIKGWKDGDRIVIKSEGYAPLTLQVTKHGGKYQAVRVEEPSKPEVSVTPAEPKPEPKPEVPVTPEKPKPEPKLEVPVTLAEPKPEPKPEVSVTPEKPKPESKSDNKNKAMISGASKSVASGPKTGDTFNVGVYGALASLAAGMLVVLGLKKRKQGEK